MALRSKEADSAYVVEATGQMSSRAIKVPVIVEEGELMGEPKEDPFEETGATPEVPETRSPKPPQHRGILIGSLMSFLSVSAAAVSFPFTQTRRDALGCDALCQGGQTSLRSALTLVGATLIGRASDRFGRVPMLWVGLLASLASLAISGGLDTLQGLWCVARPTTDRAQRGRVAPSLRRRRRGIYIPVYFPF
jgi:hypothetical protein